MVNIVVQRLKIVLKFTAIKHQTQRLKRFSCVWVNAVDSNEFSSESRETEGERQTDRQRQTDSDRETDRDRDTERDRDRDRQTDRQTDTERLKQNIASHSERNNLPFCLGTSSGSDIS